MEYQRTKHGCALTTAFTSQAQIVREENATMTKYLVTWLYLLGGMTPTYKVALADQPSNPSQSAGEAVHILYTSAIVFHRFINALTLEQM